MKLPFLILSPNGDQKIVDVDVSDDFLDPPAKTPSIDLQEDIRIIQNENKLLKAQNQALAERSEFIEDVIAEMAMAIYS